MFIIVDSICDNVCYVYLVTMASNSSKAEVEINQLKDMFKQDCHVICNVGDFSHVVSISFSDWHVKLKFQIAGITALSMMLSKNLKLYLLEI